MGRYQQDAKELLAAVGGLPGITAKLDYLKDLGVDYLWLTPSFLTAYTRKAARAAVQSGPGLLCMQVCIPSGTGRVTRQRP